MIVTSLLTKPQKQEKIADAIWTPDLALLPEDERPRSYSWYKKISLWWSLAAILTIALYIIFW
jgi:hypothetical protein